MKKVLAAAGIGAALTVGTVMLASAAHADIYSGYDAQTARYLRVLHEDNDAAVDADMSHFSDAVLIHEGHLACNAYAAGWTNRQVWHGIDADLGLPYSSNVDAAVSGSAVAVFCPQYGSRG
jgi:hypothetical protein